MNVKFNSLPVIVYFIQHLVLGYANEYKVYLTSNAPAIIGSTVTYTAELFKHHERPSGKFQYHFYDDFHPSNEFFNETTSTTVSWNVTYTGKSKVGKYTASIIVKDYFILNTFFWKEICRNDTSFELTSQLNGVVDLKQNGTLRQKYVSTAVAVDHHISLSTPDYNFIIQNATSILTFWFIDCIYYGMTVDLKPFTFNYSQPNINHRVESITIADFSPLPPTTVAPTTTTTTTPAPTTTSTTTSATTTTNAPTTTSTTTEKPTTPKSVHDVRKRSSSKASYAPESISNINQSDSYIAINSSSDSNGTILEINTNEIDEKHSNVSPMPSSNNKNHVSSNVTTAPTPSSTNDSTRALPAIYAELKYHFPNAIISKRCMKPSDVITGLNKTYAFTSQTFIAAAPVSDIVVNGAKWLQEQEVLNITVSCNGSAMFRSCILIADGLYNVTGNETCLNEKAMKSCSFPFTHWFGENPPPVHTLIIIIENEVIKTVTPVAINMYHAVKQTQLSVIVVPVVASAVAVILIVFGISFYIQSKNRYQIEVADFDFSHASDMEYKTFRERLREAILSAINRTQEFSDQESSTSSWPPPQSRKYGSMPEPENPS